jgi:hypothetical protein
MSRFIVRIELHTAGDDDYETLHDEMKAAGFKQTVKGEDGTRYELPSAEYSYKGDATIDDVREKAKAAAAKTSRRAGVLVTKSAGSAWAGLDRA